MQELGDENLTKTVFKLNGVESREKRAEIHMWFGKQLKMLIS